MGAGAERPPPVRRSLHEVVRRLRAAGHTVTAGDGSDPVVTGVCQDSRRVRPGDLYAALPGSRHDGLSFVADAAARGAVAVLGDRRSDTLPTLVVDEPRRVLGPLAAWMYGDPSTAFDLYGVTGTNGKTSTVYLLEAGLAGSGLRTGVVSGITVRGPNGTRAATRTTPEACELQWALAGFAAAGIDAAAMEVSSHGLAQHRVDGSRFRVATFTNLARDHLDFHTDMESYYAAKARLFEPERCAAAVVGVDDAYGRRLAAELTVPCRTFSARDPSADFYADSVHASLRGTSFVLCHGRGRLPVRLRLLGQHQVDNALAALAALTAGGLEPEAAIAGMEKLAAVPGRLERVDVGQPFLAFVDFVHNTGGQHRLFPYLRSLTDAKIIIVIGATGERDRGKRAPLGFTAARFADTVVVTDESTFSDDAAGLRAEVAAGARRARRADVVVLPDRARAIAAAVDLATPGDVLVVAGRGHERTMYGRDVDVAFDDRAALREALVACSYL